MKCFQDKTKRWSQKVRIIFYDTFYILQPVDYIDLPTVRCGLGSGFFVRRAEITDFPPFLKCRRWKKKKKKRFHAASEICGWWNRGVFDSVGLFAGGKGFMCVPAHCVLKHRLHFKIWKFHRSQRCAGNSQQNPDFHLKRYLANPPHLRGEGLESSPFFVARSETSKMSAYCDIFPGIRT